MKALVTGVRRIHRFDARRAARLRTAHDVVGIDCFTDYYPRPLKERTSPLLCASPKFRFVESRIQDADLPSAARRLYACVSPGGAGRRSKELGTDFYVYTVNNIEATQVLLEACAGAPIERLVYASSSSVYGDVVDDADARGRPAATRFAVRRQ